MTEPSRKLLISFRRAFAGRERNFQLRLGEVEELERLCGCGVGEIELKIATHRFGVREVRETIRLGLQGGGTSEAESTALITGYVDKAPLGEFLQLAADIILAFVSGLPELPEKKTDETSDAAAISPTST